MKIIQKTQNFILDTLFPISCLSCGEENTWLCQKCFSKIKLLSSQVCPYCEKTITDGGKICPNCKDKTLKKEKFIPLDNLAVASSYKENNIANLVHLYKYNFVRDLSIPLGQLLIKSILQNNLSLPDLIVPVPLHPRRLRWRGFNQSELLAKYVGENLTPGFSIPVFSDLVVRKHYTKPQMKIKNYRERQRNLHHAFALSSYTALTASTILLIDDIATTGSTLLECAKILKANGAKQVFGLVIARQEIKKSLHS